MSETINFNNTEFAFSSKSNYELKKAIILFKLLRYGSLTKIGKSFLKFAFKVKLPVEGILRKTIFSQFCGGENLLDCKSEIDKLFNKGLVLSILDYSVEGSESEKSFDDNLDTLLKVYQFSKNQKEIPFLVFKPTGIGKLEIFRKISENQILDKSECEQWERIKKRFETICLAVSKTDTLKVMVDAEESWAHCAVDRLTEEMMVKYNKTRTVVFTTVQLYLRHKLDYLKDLKKLSEQHKIRVGVKLVRGAYMEKERNRAFKMGYKSPICQDKAATDKNFNDGLDYVLDNLDFFDVFLGTHNEFSCKRLVRGLMVHNLKSTDGRIWFGQLFGMSDNISFNLSQAGYNVVKYVPFGPIKEVMPYLIRRAEENSSVGSQSSREIELIKKELLRRKVL